MRCYGLPVPRDVCPGQEIRRIMRSSKQQLMDDTCHFFRGLIESAHNPLVHQAETPVCTSRLFSKHVLFVEVSFAGHFLLQNCHPDREDFWLWREIFPVGYGLCLFRSAGKQRLLQFFRMMHRNRPRIFSRITVQNYSVNSAVE